MNIESDSTCRFDKLKIYDGLDASAAIIATYCYETPPPNVDYTTNNMAYITFTSDTSVAGDGFTINYSAVDSSDGQYNHVESDQGAVNEGF